ncbi:MAG: hypothetical protein AABX12_03080 [Nanoarchaeota archaeon]
MAMGGGTGRAKRTQPKVHRAVSEKGLVRLAGKLILTQGGDALYERIVDEDGDVTHALIYVPNLLEKEGRGIMAEYGERVLINNDRVSIADRDKDSSHTYFKNDEYNVNRHMYALLADKLKQVGVKI